MPAVAPQQRVQARYQIRPAVKLKNAAVTGRAGVEGDLRLGKPPARCQVVVGFACHHEDGAGQDQLVSAVARFSPLRKSRQQDLTQVARRVEGVYVKAVA